MHARDPGPCNGQVATREPMGICLPPQFISCIYLHSVQTQLAPSNLAPLVLLYTPWPQRYSLGSRPTCCRVFISTQIFAVLIRRGRSENTHARVFHVKSGARRSYIYIIFFFYNNYYIIRFFTLLNTQTAYYSQEQQKSNLSKLLERIILLKFADYFVEVC